MHKILSSLVLCFLVSTAFADTNDLFQESWDHNWRGEHAAAVRGYQEFAEANSEHSLAPVALFNSASITMVELGDLEAAQKKFRTLAENYAGTKWAADAYRRLAEIALERGVIKEAVDNYRASLKHAFGESYEMPDVWVNEVVEGCQNTLVELKDPDYAVTVYEELSTFNRPGRAAAELRFAEAQALKEVDRKEDAAKKLADLMYDYSGFPIAGRILAEEREFVSGFIELPWEDFERIGQIQGLFRQGQLEEITAIFEEVKEKHKDTPLYDRALYGLAVTELYQTGDFDAGIDKLEELLASYPNGGWTNTGKNNLDLWEDIQDQIERLSVESDDYATHVNLGYSLLRNRFFAQAEEHFQAATADSTSDTAYMGLGYVYLNTERAEEAIVAFNRFLEGNPDNGAGYNLVGYAYLGIGQTDEALKCFERYKDLEPDNPNSHDSYAECLMSLEMYEEAIKEYKRAIEIDPNFSNPYFMLGEVYSRMGDTETSLKFYQEYLDRDPNGFQSAQAQQTITELSQQ